MTYRLSRLAVLAPGLLVLALGLSGLGPVFSGETGTVAAAETASPPPPPPACASCHGTKLAGPHPAAVANLTDMTQRRCDATGGHCARLHVVVQWDTTVGALRSFASITCYSASGDFACAALVRLDHLLQRQRRLRLRRAPGIDVAQLHHGQRGGLRR